MVAHVCAGDAGPWTGQQHLGASAHVFCGVERRGLRVNRAQCSEARIMFLQRLLAVGMASWGKHDVAVAFVAYALGARPAGGAMDAPAKLPIALGIALC